MISNEKGKLIDSYSIHNLTNCKLTKLLNFFIYIALEFQVMIIDGGTINCTKKFHNIKITMRENLFKSPMSQSKWILLMFYYGSNGYKHWE